MLRRNIFTFKPNGFRSPFLLIHEEANGTVTITVRGEPDEDDLSKPQPTVFIEIPFDRLVAMTDKLTAWCMDELEEAV